MAENDEEIESIDLENIQVNWDELILPHTIKENLDFSIIWPIENLKKPRDYGTILFGLPGVGKTTIPFSIAKKLGWKLFYISPKNFITKDKNPEHAIKTCFEQIKKEYSETRKLLEKYEKGGPPGNRPVANMVFVFDEIDELVTTRGDMTDKDSRLLTTMMLPLLNELREDAEKYNFIFFALTNHIRRFDIAITRKGRFDLVLPLGLPSRAGRYLWLEFQIKKLKEKYVENGFQIFDSHSETRLEVIEKKDKEGKIQKKNKNVELEVSDVDLNILSRASDGLSFGDIESICKRVVESELRKESDVREFLKKPKKERKKVPISLRIETDSFLEWMNRLRQLSKINHEDLKRFNEDSIIYTRGSSSNTELNQIVGDTIKEFDSIDIKHEYNSKRTLTIWIRNLSEFSSFSLNKAFVHIVINSSKPKLKELDFKRLYLLSGQSTEPLEISIPSRVKKVKLEYHINGIFTLKGVSGTTGNVAELHGEITSLKIINF